jgi:GNAT acetyltransferase
MPLSDLDLMRLELDTSFTYDARGRTLLSNSPHLADRKRAPHVIMARTSLGHIVRFHADVPDDVAQEITEIVAREPTDSDLHVPPTVAAEIEAVLSRHAPIVEQASGPTYHFPDPMPSLGEAIRITADTRDLVRDTFPWLHEEYAEWWPAFAVLHDDAGVSACFSSRIGPLAMAAGVSTLPEFRRRGYAAIATAAWGTAVRMTGRIPFYGTTWDNLASQGVARRLSLAMHGAVTSWT